MSDRPYTQHRKLEALRKGRGMKRSQLAKRSGVSYQHIYGMEEGFNAVADETLQLVANALDVHISLIVEDKDKSDDKVGDSTHPTRRQDQEKTTGPKRATEVAA